MLRPATSAPVEVDDEFEREFAQLMLDHQGRGARQAPGGPGAGGAAGPAGGPALLPAAAAPHGGGDGEAGGGGAGEAVAFKVMMKRGGREDRSRELRIPLSAGMAAHLRQKEEREAAEKAELKRLVLEANKRDQQARMCWGWGWGPTTRGTAGEPPSVREGAATQPSV